MRNTILTILVLVVAPLSAAEEIKSFVNHLSAEQKATLSQFLYALCQRFGGYVLYGDKPISLWGYSIEAESHTGKYVLPLIKGREFWQNLSLDMGNKEYPIIIFEQDYYVNFICINRKAFTKVVNENLSLFRYILGPTLTPENLLKNLIQAREQFYSVLKNDDVLLGILLGYGTQNALLYSREQYISKIDEEFPFISRKKRELPSIGFFTLEEEAKRIGQMITTSHSFRPLDDYQLPYFGCVADSEETKALMVTYKKNQEDLLKAAQSGTFLEDTLAKLFTTTSQTIDIPSIPRENQFCKNLTKLYQSFKNPFFKQEEVDENPQQFMELYKTKVELERCENLNTANDYFKTLTSKNIVSLIPNGVCYKITKQGKGSPASRKVKNVSFHYTFHIVGQKKHLDYGTVKQENIEYLIPGIAHSLIGMKRSEERLIYLHPRYAYGEDSFFPPNHVIVTRIRLLDFEEGKSEVAVSQPHDLVIRNYEELSAKIKSLSK